MGHPPICDSTDMGHPPLSKGWGTLKGHCDLERWGTRPPYAVVALLHLPPRGIGERGQLSGRVVAVAHVVGGRINHLRQLTDSPADAQRPLRASFGSQGEEPGSPRIERLPKMRKRPTAITVAGTATHQLRESPENATANQP